MGHLGTETAWIGRNGSTFGIFWPRNLWAGLARDDSVKEPIWSKAQVEQEIPKGGLGSTVDRTVRLLRGR